MEIVWVRTIIVIILFSSPSVVSLCGKAHADGILGKFLEAFEKANSSNNPKSSKSKKDKKVKSASEDSPKKDEVVSPSVALGIGGLGGYDVFKFGMGADEINKKTACNLEAVPESEGLIPGIDVLLCRDFSFDNQPAEAYFAFVDGMLQGLTISIPFDKNKLKSLPEKYATKYGVPTSVSPKSDFEAWEKGDPDARICFVYPNGAIRWSFLIGESGKHHKIIIIYSSEKLIELVDAEDAREAKEDAAIKLSADFNVDPVIGSCPLEVHFKDKSVGRVREGWWDFGNGEKSTEQNPTHIYNSPGTYTVKLTVSNKVATDEAIKIVQVLPEKLVADFSFSLPTEYEPQEIQFVGNSSGDPGKWHWDFGDGGESDSQMPLHTYGKPGTYTVSLLVSNTTDRSVKEKEIVVFPVKKEIEEAKMKAIEKAYAEELEIEGIITLYALDVPIEEVEEMIAAAKRGMKAMSKMRVPITKQTAINEWWKGACEELMDTRRYFSEKDIYEIMFILSEDSIKRIEHSYLNKNNPQNRRDECAAMYVITNAARLIIDNEYRQKSEHPEFSEITYYTREYNTGLMRPRPELYK